MAELKVWRWGTEEVAIVAEGPGEASAIFGEVTRVMTPESEWIEQTEPMLWLEDESLPMSSAVLKTPAEIVAMNGRGILPMMPD
jgi:hypothetical protein